jgi:hypothetical protein
VEVISGIAETYGFGKKDTLSKMSLNDLTKTIATKLNSTPNNLNPEDSYENQAIEVVRGQAVNVSEKLEKMVDTQEDGILTYDEVKAQLMIAFKETESDTPIKEFANRVRAIILSMIENNEVDDMAGLIRILSDVKASTGIDLSKKDNSKKQTGYALTLVAKCSKLTGRKLLNELFKLREIPSEP